MQKFDTVQDLMATLERLANNARKEASLTKGDRYMSVRFADGIDYARGFVSDYAHTRADGPQPTPEWSAGSVMLPPEGVGS